MIASDTAVDQGWSAAEPEEPVPDVARSELRVRPEAYRQLWQPPGRRPAPRQAIGQPYVWDGGEAAPDGSGTADDLAGEPRRPVRRRQPERWPQPARRREPERRREPVRRRQSHADALLGPALTTERAIIGDLLRQLAAWCQIGACIASHTDEAALGEADIRNRAVAAGWCVDLFGRLVCPSCQQRYPVWSARPPVQRG